MREIWAGIVRVSHLGGRSGDTFHADDDQVADVQRYAAQHGAEVVFMPAELDVSGGLPIHQRPALQAAIEGVEAGRFTGIVASYLSRLTRSRSGLEIWDRVEAAGGTVHCAQENLDTSTVNGRFIRDIHLAEAVRVREEHAERHDRRRDKTIAAGVWPQRQVPRGLTFIGPPDAAGRYRGLARKLKPGPDADEVRQAFRARAAGETVSAIAKRLGMTTGGIRAMLANRIYLGEMTVGKYTNKAACEPLIDPATFAAANHSQPRPPRRRSRFDGPALLAGLVRCASCGHRMTRGSTSAGHPVYLCPGKHSGQHCPGIAAIACKQLDEYVTPLALDELEQIKTRAGTGDSLKAAAEQRSQAERELAAYLSAVSAADVGATAFATGAAERRQRLDDAILAEQRLLAARPVVVPISTSANRIWHDLHVQERNVLLGALLDAVVVRRAGGRGAVNVPIEQRVRVVRAGSGLALPARTRGTAMGLHPIDFDHIAPPAVLGMPGGQDLL